MNIKSSTIKSICMLSTHGYFDPVPQLGRTDTGGQVLYVLELAKALSRMGVEVDIYTRWFDNSKSQAGLVENYPGVRVMRIKAGPWEFIPKEAIYDVLPELAKNMVAFIKENRLQYDLFHGHYVDAGIVTLDVARAFGKPAFFTAHSLGAWKREQMSGDSAEMEQKYNFKHRIAEELRIFKSVAAQSVTTILQQEKLAELYDFESDNVVVISPGVDVHHFKSPEKDTDTVETGFPEKYVFCLSRIDSNKGHDLLLKAFDIVRKEVSGVDLVIGGGSSEPQEREIEVLDAMKNIVDEREMQERVRIIGYVPDELLVMYYQQSELFVLPSIFEPFGMTALEAMACGRPVVASKFGGIKNVITSGENGLLIDPENAEEFAQAIVTILSEEELSEKYGMEGQKTILEYFSWEAIANRHIEFYKRFMSS